MTLGKEKEQLEKDISRGNK